MCPETASSTARSALLARVVLPLADLHRRMLAVYFALAGPRIAYRVTGILAHLLYRLLQPIRERSEAQCRSALEAIGRFDASTLRQKVPQIARRAFVHRIWNLTDLTLAERLLHPNTFHRYGGRIPEPHLSRLLDAQRRRQAAILVTAYYGPIDLLPVFLGYNGVRAGVVYQPHANKRFDAYRRRVRARGGCELVAVDHALDRLERILADGGTVAIVADHHGDRRGLPASFLGLATMAMRSVGLLAWRYHADVVVAGIRRNQDAFRFDIVVAGTIDHQEWENVEDPVVYVTDRYLRALETLILGDPAQYLWGHARWGEEFARKLVAREEAASDEG